jgi:hypothetical protein
MIREYRYLWYFFFKELRGGRELDSLFPKKYKCAYPLYNPFNRERRDVCRANKHHARDRWIRGYDFRSMLR